MVSPQSLALLEKERRSQGLSYAALGRKAYLSRWPVRRILKQKQSNPKTENVKALARALGVELPID